MMYVDNVCAIVRILHTTVRLDTAAVLVILTTHHRAGHLYRRT